MRAGINLFVPERFYSSMHEGDFSARDVEGGGVVIHYRGQMDIFLEWIWNLAKSGRYEHFELLLWGPRS